MSTRGCCGWLVGMNPRRSLIALTAATALAGAAPAHADSPPVVDGVHCHITVKKTQRLGKVLRRGLPVKVNCDGAAKFLVMPDFAAMSGASEELAETYGSHYPAVARAVTTKLDDAGSMTVRPKFTKAGKKILKHHKRTKILVGLGTMRTDGHFWSDPGDWAYTALTR
jgi:hypothetical protein